MLRKILVGYYRLGVPVGSFMAEVYDYLGDTFKLSAMMVRKSVERTGPFAEDIERRGFIEAFKSMFEQCMEDGEEDFEDYMALLGRLQA